MNSKKRNNGTPKVHDAATGVVGRKGPFGNMLHDDPYTAQIQSLLRKAKSTDEVEARPALLELFYRFHLRLPLQEARLSHALPWNREPSKN
jgi:hypothetical protein